MISTLAFLIAAVKPTGIAVIVNQESDTASIVDIAAYTVTHVPVGGGPHESAVSPSGKTGFRERLACFCLAQQGERDGG